MLSDKKGNVLIFLVVGMSMMVSLGLGMLYMNTTSTFGQLSANNLNKAQYLAESGIRYALKLMRDGKLSVTGSDGTDYTLSTTTNGKFNLKVSDEGTNRKVRSAGILNPDTPFEVRKEITVTIPKATITALNTPFSFAGGGGQGITALAAPALGGGISGKSGVEVYGTQIYLGYDRLTTAGIQNSAGCVWYQGWADSNGSDCIAGKCNFNKGIRAYFDFDYTNWVADGFTFALASAHYDGTNYINDVTDCGGGSCGEYMGYAGPGSKASKHGLQPPKLAVEFDPYIPSCPSPDPDYSWISSCATPPSCLDSCKRSCNCSSSGCLDLCDVCGCNSRYDRSFASPHASLIYWGGNTVPEACNSTNYNTYDDNKHGVGDSKSPINPQNSDGAGNGFKIYNFGASGSLSFRIEIDRVDVPDANPANPNSGMYKIRVWLTPLNANRKDLNGAYFNDTSIKYNNTGDDAPTFQKTISLDSGWHNKFDRILFGWTQGTGGSTQVVNITNFKIDFKNKNDF
jgi:hypothetical protein